MCVGLGAYNIQQENKLKTEMFVWKMASVLIISTSLRAFTCSRLSQCQNTWIYMCDVVCTVAYFSTGSAGLRTLTIFLLFNSGYFALIKGREAAIKVTEGSSEIVVR